MISIPKKFIQEDSSDRTLNHAVQGEFLQSEYWRKFQEDVGRKTFNISGNGFGANIIEHKLPIVGKYFYIPRGPVVTSNLQPTTHNSISELIYLAKKEKAGWIRFDASNSRILDLIRSHWRVVRAPHDMQPKEILVVDITKPEEELLAQMKPKTRYNIRLAEKKGVRAWSMEHRTWNNKYIKEFLRLMKITARRDKITPHPESYYRKMFEAIPPEILKLYVAEYDSKIIAANIIIHYGKTATYLHGASDSEHRNVMAPHLLQWQAILDAKKAGLERYDFGGIATSYKLQSTSWSGITRFKTSFSPAAKPIQFPGSHDIIIDQSKYSLYKIFQKIKTIWKH